MLEMATFDEWQNISIRRSFLAKQLRKGRLALVLGAGISIPFGLPSWSELVQRLYKSRGAVPPDEASPQQAAEAFLNIQCAGDRIAFAEAVHETLYQEVQVDFGDLVPRRTLVAIGALVMGSRRGSVAEVITFNFDDILEQYLRYHGFVVRSRNKGVFWADQCDVEVYHPHGFLPKTAVDYKTDLIFDQKRYSEEIGNESKPWRQLLLSIFRRHTCAFVGVGASDGNLDSLLVRAWETHASRETQQAFWGVRFVSRAESEQRPFEVAHWKSRGVYSVIVEDYEEGLPGELLAVCQVAAGEGAV